MGFKNMKRDDHGHVISNDEVDGQECKHVSGQADKVEDQKYNKEMKEAQEQNALMSDAFDDDYEEEFNAYKEPDARPNHTKLTDMNLSDSEVWNMAYQYIGNDKLEKLAESLDLDSPQDLKTNDMLKYMSDDDIGDMMRINGLDDEFEDESQEEYEARIKPEAEKLKKQLNDAGYKLKDKEYGLEKADKNNIKLLEGDKFSIDGRDFEITRIDRNGQHIVAKDDTGTEFDWTRDALLNDKSFKLDEDDEFDLEDAIKNADDDILDEQFGKDTPERKLVGAIKEQSTGISEWDKKHQDFLEKGKSTWNQKLKKGDKITIQDKNGNDVEVYINGFWKNGELVDEDTYEEGKDNHWHDFRGVGIADKDGKNLGSVNAFQIKKHSREQQNPPMTKEQRQSIRDQINKMVASLDDARSVDEAWDIEEGIKELEDMLKKFKGK